MSVMTVTRETVDLFDDGETLICRFCDEATNDPFCGSCDDHKGLVTIAEWESLTGETWE